MSSLLDLTNKKAVVTGAAAGIGRACVLALTDAGAAVAAVDINGTGATETIEEAGKGVSVGCDLRDAISVEAMSDRVLKEFGGVDIVVNCAGIIAYGSGVAAVSIDEWDLVMEVNLRGTFLVCRAFMDSLKQRRDGRIINFSSLAARVGGVEVGVHYTASKSGLIGFTRALAKEGGPYGITANAVAPGIILTGPVQERIAGSEAAYREQIPMNRLGAPEEVANTVLFLASPLSSYVTGIVLDVNGGMFMG